MLTTIYVVSKTGEVGAYQLAKQYSFRVWPEGAFFMSHGIVLEYRSPGLFVPARATVPLENAPPRTKPMEYYSGKPPALSLDSRRVYLPDTNSSVTMSLFVRVCVFFKDVNDYGNHTFMFMYRVMFLIQPSHATKLKKILSRNRNRDMTQRNKNHTLV